MNTALGNVVYSIYARLPFLKRLSRNTVERGLLRIKYVFPFLLDKNHLVEGLLRKVIFLNYIYSAIGMAVYFWVVNFYSTQGVTMQAGAIPMAVNWIVSSYFCRKFHEIYLINKKDELSHITSPYIYNSVVAGIIGVATTLWVVAKLDNIQIGHPGQLGFQFFFLLFFFNYFSQIFITEMNITFVQHDVFHPQWIKALWVLIPLYLIFRNIDFFLGLLRGS